MAQKTTQTNMTKVAKASSLSGDEVRDEASFAVPQEKEANPAEHEKWLHQDSQALASVKRGLADLAAGRVHVRRSYAEYADLDVED